VSLRGQFNVQVADPNTITPMQREFIRLAQIFKSRLVAEREIQQRVMERGLIEDRFSKSYASEMTNAREEEAKAAREVVNANKAARTQQLNLISASGPIIEAITTSDLTSSALREWTRSIDDIVHSATNQAVNSMIEQGQANVLPENAKALALRGT
jgi:hypothetical protein